MPEKMMIIVFVKYRNNRIVLYYLLIYTCSKEGFE